MMFPLRLWVQAAFLTVGFSAVSVKNVGVGDITAASASEYGEFD